ncbi:MAG TPA: helix-turn-helix transcriptional regulator [Terracidiphilus sp.]|nr:helix-turn-helix transcriptional regulator [Terracidiphilus sp.]
MDDRDKPNLSLGDLASITDEHYLADRSAWDALRPLLKSKGWSETTRFNGPRPPKETAKFYLILSNYSTEVFFLEARMYPRYPPNPNFRTWILKLAQRVEDHVIGVVKDIETSDSEKDFSFHSVSEDQMRKTIQERLEKEIKDHFSVEFPRSGHLLPRIRRVSQEELRKSGIDPESTMPLLREAMKQMADVAPATPPKDKQSFSEELDRLLRAARTSPESIAEMIDVDPTTVYRHKSGKISPTLATVSKYEQVLSGILEYKVQLPTPAKRQKSKRRQ